MTQARWKCLQNGPTLPQLIPYPDGKGVPAMASLEKLLPATSASQPASAAFTAQLLSPRLPGATLIYLEGSIMVAEPNQWLLSVTL